MIKYLQAPLRFCDDTTTLEHDDPSADLTLLLTDTFPRTRIAV